MPGVRLRVPFLVAMLVPCAALAHGGHEHAADLPWQADGWVIGLLLASAAGYLAGAWRLQRAGRDAVLGRWRLGAFVAGTLVLVAALLSPLDALADRYFSAHMTQHLLLMLVAPPLLVASQPAVAWMWCLDAGRRRRLARWWARGAGARLLLRVLLHPAVVWLAASAALWFWHLPRPYGWALANESIHTLEHTSFFLTSLAFWYLLFSPRGRASLGYGGAIMFGVTFGMQNGFLGAVLTFATHPFYAAHAVHHGILALSALEDQQLAGLIMWVPASIVHLGLLGVLCAQWIRDDERRSSAAAGLPTFPTRPRGLDPHPRPDPTT
jgi:putative membrane protein